MIHPVCLKAKGYLTQNLSGVFSRAAIRLANEHVGHDADEKNTYSKMAYQKLAEELKAKIGKYAAENGIAAVVRHF